jgi:hypothetical protein
VERRPTVDNFNEVIIIFVNDSIRRDINAAAACKKIRSSHGWKESLSLDGTKDNNNFSNHSTFVHLTSSQLMHLSHVSNFLAKNTRHREREREIRIMMSLVKFGPRGRNQIRAQTKTLKRTTRSSYCMCTTFPYVVDKGIHMNRQENHRRFTFFFWVRLLSN